MLTVADHHGIGRTNLFLFEDMGDQLALVRPGAVEFAAVDVLKVNLQRKVLDDLTGEYRRAWRSPRRVSVLWFSGR